MPTTRDFLEFHSLSADTILSIIDRANFLAEAWFKREMPPSLKDIRVAVITDDSGWRNTTAFDLGVQAMGGICAHPPISFDVREDTPDLAEYLDNWFDVIVARTKELSALQTLAACAEAPVINARTRSNHPCEILGDLAYIVGKRGAIDGLKVAIVAPNDNILRSWVEASISLPIEVRQIYPADWHDASLLNPNFSSGTDPADMLDADVIITDAWPGNATKEQLLSYQISAALLEKCRSGLMFLPCPPVARGMEVSTDAMEHPACQSRMAKAFLLHGQNALLEWAAGRE
ncbi:ornithine carbamoyltransferase [Mesorhizobium sp. ANAO-SY3R2]|uniref:ornithine carbamoyltransferase n=1 Tax=Mesorhizobium sp. ANAO-SY3R2 TaxID=3166644 RepID=UPI00366D83EA